MTKPLSRKDKIANYIGSRLCATKGQLETVFGSISRSDLSNLHYDRKSRAYYIDQNRVKNVTKIQEALKHGNIVTFRGRKISGEKLIRKGPIREIKTNKDGSQSIVYNDTLRSGFRSIKASNLNEIKIEKGRVFQV